MTLRFPLARTRPADQPVDHPPPVRRVRNWAVVLASADRACCCPARPLVAVVMPAAPGRREPADLLLCGHHYRAARRALAAAGAVVFDASGTVCTEEWPAETPGMRPAPAA